MNKPHIRHDEMSEAQKYVFTVLMLIGLSLTIAFGFWWFRPIHIPNNFSGIPHIFDIVAFALLSYVVWYQISYELFSWYLTDAMQRPGRAPRPQEGLRVAFLTAFVPGKEPYDVLERTLSAMVSVDYPHDTWLLDEGDDAETKRICKKYSVIHYSRKGRPQYNTLSGKYQAKTKAGNYNSWFDQFADRYDIVAQHDVDFIPHKNFLTRTLGYFRDEEIAFVGTPQIYGNKDESWIARGAAEQAYGFYGPIQKGLYGHDMPLFIGANHIIRVQAHHDIEGYSGHIVEDHLTGMKLYAKRWKSVYVPEILAIGEGPATWDSYFGQQMRWSYGLIDILFRHSPTIFTTMRKGHRLNYFLLQQYYFYGLSQAIGILLLMLYFIFGFQSTSMALKPLLLLYVPLMLFQLLIFFWLQSFYIDPKEERGFLWRGRLLSLAAWPIYFVALIGVLIGKRLTYVVTPKGKEQSYDVALSLFMPHFILGSITAFGIEIAIFTGHTAPQILFWAIINTIVMYFFVGNALFQNFRSYLRSLFKPRAVLKQV